MKIKCDFVTNSSSVSYLISVHNKSLDKFMEHMKKLDRHPDGQNEGVGMYLVAKTMDELNEYTNGRPYDWASKPCGLDYYNMSEKHHERCKEAIEEGHVAIYCSVDWNIEDPFEGWEDVAFIMETFC